MNNLKLISGARLSEGGLHLGHYLGCLSPLTAFPEDEYCFYFIITDTSPAHRLVDQATDPDLINMASDLLATKYAARVKIVLQSRILCEGPVLFTALKDLITFRQLQGVHPQRQKIRENQANLSTSDFTFILDEIFGFLALDASYVLMNDDNFRFVCFARRTAKKFNNVYGRVLSEPLLRHGTVSRLLGKDEQRMTKANGNAIYLSETGESLRNKAQQLVNSTQRAGFIRLDSAGKPIQSDSSPVPDTFLPFTYLRVFGDPLNAETIVTDFKEGSLSIYDLADEVFRTLEGVMAPIREAREYYRHRPQDVWAKIEEDSAKTLEVVHATEKRVVDAIRRRMSR